MVDSQRQAEYALDLGLRLGTDFAELSLRFDETATSLKGSDFDIRVNATWTQAAAVEQVLALSDLYVVSARPVAAAHDFLRTNIE